MKIPLCRRSSEEIRKSSPRRGAVVPLLAISIVPLMGMLAFSIDYGFLRVVKSDL